MKRILIILLLATIYAQAEPIWFSGRQKDWEKNKNKGLYMAVAVLNHETVDTLYTTNDVPYYVTNYVHTAENTNNALWQINFSLTNARGENCWIMGYDTRKIFFDINLNYQELYDFCHKSKKFMCGRGMGLTEYMTENGYGWQSNAWLTLDIPFVDDGQQTNERKNEFTKSKKK